MASSIGRNLFAQRTLNLCGLCSTSISWSSETTFQKMFWTRAGSDLLLSWKRWDLLWALGVIKVASVLWLFVCSLHVGKEQWSAGLSSVLARWQRLQETLRSFVSGGGWEWEGWHRHSGFQEEGGSFVLSSRMEDVLTEKWPYELY